MVYANTPHPEDGSPCPEHFRGYRGCGTCIQRGHVAGHHDQCNASRCGVAMRRERGDDDRIGSLRFRYEVIVVDQDGRVIHRDFDYVLVNGYHAADASTRVASDARFWFAGDQSVNAFYVAAGAKDDPNQFWVQAYRRSDNAPGNSGWLYLGGDMGPLDEVLRQSA